MRWLVAKFFKSNSDDWKGRRFLFLSVALTTVSIIFFLVGRYFLFTIGIEDHKKKSRAAELTRRVEVKKSERENEIDSSWKVFIRSAVAAVGQLTARGDLRVKNLQLQIVEGVSGEESSFREGLERLETWLKVFEGKSFWSINLDEIKEKALAEGWVKTVYVRRIFPDTLRVDLWPRVPTYLVRGQQKWWLVDEEGKVLTGSKEIPGRWVQLPIVFGLESTYIGGTTLSDLNRRLVQEAEIFRDLSALLLQLKERVGIEVDHITVQPDEWTNEFTFTVRFPMKRKNDIVELEATFLSNQWVERLESFQFILSDLAEKNWPAAKISGQFHERWYVEPTGFR